jgi:hypothetical protein
MKRYRFVVCEVHRHLHHATACQLYTNGLEMRDTSVRLPDFSGDGPGDMHIGRQEIDIEGNQGGSGSDDDGTRCLMKVTGTEVRRPVRIVGDPESEAFQAAATDRFKGSMVTVRRRTLVQKDRNLEFRSNAVAKSFGRLHTISHREAFNGNERYDIGSADPWMHARMPAQVDQIGRHANRSEHRFHHLFRVPHDSQD